MKISIVLLSCIFLCGCNSKEFCDAYADWKAAESEWNAAHVKGDQAAMHRAFDKEIKAFEREIKASRFGATRC